MPWEAAQITIPDHCQGQHEWRPGPPARASHLVQAGPGCQSEAVGGRAAVAPQSLMIRLFGGREAAGQGGGPNGEGRSIGAGPLGSSGQARAVGPGPGPGPGRERLHGERGRGWAGGGGGAAAAAVAAAAGTEPALHTLPVARAGREAT